MKIILDFDHTLFSTKKLFDSLKEEFKESGVNDKLFSETFQKSKDPVGYNSENQFKLIIEEKPVLNPKKLKEVFKKVINRADQFVYPDVLPVLRNLKKENQLILLSYGEKKFQKEKIEDSKITKYFNKIIITQDINKVSDLKKILKEKEIAIFVEDNPYAILEVKKSFPKIITIRINRGEGKYAKEKNNDKTDFVIENLSELKKVFEKKTK